MIIQIMYKHPQAGIRCQSKISISFSPFQGPLIYASLFSITSAFLLQYAFNFFFPFFRATPAAYGSSQARGQFRATAAGHRHSHSHSNAGSEPHLQATPQLTAMLDP